MKKGILNICSKNGKNFIKSSEIQYCQAAGRYTILRTDSDSTRVTENLKCFENKLNKRGFVRIHHSYIVNLKFMKEYRSESNEVLINCGKLLPISLIKKSIFLKKVSSYYK